MKTPTAAANRMLFLSESNVKQCLSMKDCIDVNRQALISLTNNGGGIVPTRIALPYQSSPLATTTSTTPSTPSSQDWSLFKPATYQQSDGSTSHMGMKLVSVRSENPSRFGLPMVPATIMVVDPPSGMVEAVVSATYLTAARTAAGSALATQLCCRSNSKHVLVFGAGCQAECHLEAIQCVVPTLERITIVNRNRDRADTLAAQQTLPTTVLELQDTIAIQQALQDADIVVACTNTMTPLFDGTFLSKGCHVNGIGSFTPDMQEIDDATVQRSIVLIDTPDAKSVGDLKVLGLVLLMPRICYLSATFSRLQISLRGTETAHSTRQLERRFKMS
ncbi:Shikimate / quinate 5-dehydrogenase [Fragilaria crotonensis]|nr:Shikimate / quinate 5-dehydrogenase [Fragilaria crotonensis]